MSRPFPPPMVPQGTSGTHDFPEISEPVGPPAEPTGPHQRLVADPAALSDPIIRAQSLTKRFDDVAALDDVSFSIGPGVTGLIGANGAGKTTLMLTALGLLAPTSGRIDILVGDSAPTAIKRQKVSFVPERETLPAEATAIAAVTHMARTNGLPAKAAATSASDSLWLVGMAEERNRAIRTMSTGQKQRVKLAQALASAPTLVMLDEPTAGLDPAQHTSMLNLISDVSRDFGISFLLSSHLLQDIQSTCQHVIALDVGRLIAAGPTEQVLADEVTGVRIEFAEEMSDEEMGAIGAEICANFAEATATRVVAADPTLVIRARPDTPFTELANRCRNVLAERELPIRTLVPHQRSLEDLYNRYYQHSGDPSASQDKVLTR